MKKWVDMQTDIFMFIIAKGIYNNDVNYNILEKIKDGKARSTKYKGKKMRFERPNVIIVFSNMYPDTRGFSQDRWLIFKINTKMMLQEVTIEQIKKKEDVNDAKNIRWIGKRKHFMIEILYIK